jgi:aminotransferase
VNLSRPSFLGLEGSNHEVVVKYPLFLVKLLIRTGLVRYLPGIHRLTEGGTEFLPFYSDRVLSAPRADLKRVASLLEQLPPDAIDLSQGTPRIDPVPSTSPRVPADRRGWPPPWGLPELRGAVAEQLLIDSRLAASPADEVLITHGAAGAFHTVLDAFVNRGDRVVLFDPTSPLFPLVLRSRGIRINWIYSWVEEGRARFRLPELDRALRRARLLVLTQPGNPGGGFIAPEDLEQIAWWAERHGVLIYSDESFGRFHYEGERVSIGTLARARRRTLTAGSISKSHGLSSLRVGWVTGHRHLVRPCLLAAALNVPFVPTVCQQLALAALRQSSDAFEDILGEFSARRRYAFERLHGMGLQPSWPSGGFYFWVPVWDLGLNGQDFAARLLAEKKVQVTPGDLFGPSGVGHVRISYATEEGRLREGLLRLEEFVGELVLNAEEQPEPEQKQRRAA